MTEKSFSLPVPGILLLVFVLCKVFEYGPIAAWSWVWVLAPLWIPFSIAVIFAVLFGAMALLNELLDL